MATVVSGKIVLRRGDLRGAGLFAGRNVFAHTAVGQSLGLRTRVAGWFVAENRGHAIVTSRGRVFWAFRPNLAVLDSYGHAWRKRLSCDRA